MEWFSNCSGECCICACAGGCFAGRGDDDFSPASEEQVIERIKNDEYPSYRQMMLDYVGLTENDVKEDD